MVKNQKFSVRKLKIGVASVAVATAFAAIGTQSVSADELQVRESPKFESLASPLVPETLASPLVNDAADTEVGKNEVLETAVSETRTAAIETVEAGDVSETHPTMDTQAQLNAWTSPAPGGGRTLAVDMTIDDEQPVSYTSLELIVESTGVEISAVHQVSQDQDETENVETAYKTNATATRIQLERLRSGSTFSIAFDFVPENLDKETPIYFSGLLRDPATGLTLAQFSLEDNMPVATEEVTIKNKYVNEAQEEIQPTDTKTFTQHVGKEIDLADGPAVIKVGNVSYKRQGKFFNKTSEDLIYDKVDKKTTVSVEHYYTRMIGTIVQRYFDNLGNVLQPHTYGVVDGNIDDHYDLTSKRPDTLTIKGVTYKLDRVAGNAAEKGTVTDGFKSIDYFFKKVDDVKGSVQLLFKDTNGKRLETVTPWDNEKEGTAFDLTSHVPVYKEVSGSWYALANVSGNLTGKVTEGTKTVTVTYKQLMDNELKATLIESYFDQYGNQLQPDQVIFEGWAGDTYDRTNQLQGLEINGKHYRVNRIEGIHVSVGKLKPGTNMLRYTLEEI